MGRCDALADESSAVAAAAPPRRDQPPSPGGGGGSLTGAAAVESDDGCLTPDGAEARRGRVRHKECSPARKETAESGRTGARTCSFTRRVAGSLPRSPSADLRRGRIQVAPTASASAAPSVAACGAEGRRDAEEGGVCGAPAASQREGGMHLPSVSADVPLHGEGVDRLSALPVGAHGEGVDRLSALPARVPLKAEDANRLSTRPAAVPFEGEGADRLSALPAAIPLEEEGAEHLSAQPPAQDTQVSGTHAPATCNIAATPADRSPGGHDEPTQHVCGPEGAGAHVDRLGRDVRLLGASPCGIGSGCPPPRTLLTPPPPGMPPAAMQGWMKGRIPSQRRFSWHEVRASSWGQRAIASQWFPARSPSGGGRRGAAPRGRWHWYVLVDCQLRGYQHLEHYFEGTGRMARLIVTDVVVRTAERTLELSLQGPHNTAEPTRALFLVPTVEACRLWATALHRASQAHSRPKELPISSLAVEQTRAPIESNSTQTNSSESASQHYASNYATNSGKRSWYVLRVVDPRSLPSRLHLALHGKKFGWV
ncbi:hypothetical protein AB1Y20_008713 [Prymnesium parvum]|uniref:PH domain-containing protein n=1 Tax=Prymnesium parvum TaxID=97485 RepID=A0AB34IR36_PRYPA